MREAAGDAVRGGYPRRRRGTRYAGAAGRSTRGHATQVPAPKTRERPDPRAGAPRQTLVLEQQLPVLRQRPEVVGDDRLERVDDLAQRVLRRDDVVNEHLR